MGKVESGTVCEGDPLLIMPNKVVDFLGCCALLSFCVLLFSCMLNVKWVTNTH